MFIGSKRILYALVDFTGAGGAGVGVSFFCIFDIPFLGDFFSFFGNNE